MIAADIPAKFNIPFAASAGAGFTRPIPQASQIGIQAGAASLADGFPPVNFLPVGAGGTPFWGADVNGILNQETKWSQWFSAGAPVKYDAAFQTAIGGYPKGTVVASATSFATWWLSTNENNTTDPDAGGVGWVRTAPLNLYGVDVGSANAYRVTFAPPLLARIVGLPLRVRIANGNTGAAFIDDDLGGVAIVRRDGSALAGGELVTGHVATIIWNGVAYELPGIYPSTPAAAAAATDAQSAITPALLAAQLASQFVAALTNPGWQKMLPSGLILQWGTTGSIGSGTVVSLPIAFPAAGLIPLATINGSPAAVAGAVLTPTTIQLFSSAAASYHWLALGH